MLLKIKTAELKQIALCYIKNENHLLFIHIISISLEKEESKTSLRLQYLNNFFSGTMVPKLVMTISLKDCYHI